MNAALALSSGFAAFLAGSNYLKNRQATQEALCRFLSPLKLLKNRQATQVVIDSLAATVFGMIGASVIEEVF